MLIAIAIIGWVLFAFTAILYLAGNKMNVAETNALAIYCLSILLSDEYYEANKEMCKKNVVEHKEFLSSIPKEAVYAAMQGITEGAKQLGSKNLEVVMVEIEKMKSN